MKKFFKDYWGLCKESCNFYKKHWLGMIILSGVTYVVTWLSLGGASIIKDKIESTRNDEE